MMKIAGQVIIWCLIGTFLFMFLYVPMGCAEEQTDEYVVHYVTANILNGREKPTKNSYKEAFFDQGDAVKATGKWSRDRKWIEIVAGETGTVWCDARYLSEYWDNDIVVVNKLYKKVKIRKRPVDGGVVAYLKQEHELMIDRVVLGWGHSKKGWIDMSLVQIED